MLGTSLWRLAVCMAINICVSFSRGAPCILPDKLVKILYFDLQDNSIHYLCYGCKRSSVCLGGQWNPPIQENCDLNPWQTLKEFNCQKKVSPTKFRITDKTPERERRSPNVGKFEELKRLEVQQRKISEGILETLIDSNTPRIVRVHPGSRAFLLCRVQNLGTNSVMWLLGDQVLSIDHNIFLPDARFSQTFEKETETWIMEIRKVMRSDEGDYTCKVTTKPFLQRVVTLEVIPRGFPLLPPKTRSSPKKNGNRNRPTALGELRENVTALWSEMNEVKVLLHQHIFSNHLEHHQHHHGDHHEDHQHQDHYHEDHHHDDHHHDDHGHFHFAEHDKQNTSTHGLDDHYEDHDHGSSHHHYEDEHGLDHHHHHHHHDYEHGLDHHHHDYDHISDHHYHDSNHHHGSQDHDVDHHQHSHGNETDHHHNNHDYSTSHHYEHKYHLGGHDYSKHHYHDDHSSRESDEDGEDDENEPLKMGKCPKCQMMMKKKIKESGEDHYAHHSDHDNHHHGHYHHNHHHEHKPMVTAECVLIPNAEGPASNVTGRVIITQRRDGKGPLYFDISLHDVGVPEDGSERIHGFHIHDRPIADDKCSSAGAHFNPTKSTHGPPYSLIRHAGDLGNIKLDEHGHLHNYIISDDKVSFIGPKSIVNRSLVLHALADDLGQGGNEGSLKTGNAGPRLACCTIKAKSPAGAGFKPVIRFNG